MPTMMAGSAAVFIDCDELWKLLLVTKRGAIFVWDLLDKTCLLHDSLSSLVTLGHDSTNKDSGIISCPVLNLLRKKILGNCRRTI